MKIIVLKENLKEGLKLIEKGINPSADLEILKNFSLKTANGKINLVSTNLELAISTFINGKITAPGKTIIPFNLFSSIINNLENERITLELIKDKLIIKTDNYQAEIKTLKDDYPIIPKIDKEFYLKTSSKLLYDYLNLIINSVAINSKPELTGILFDFQLTLIKLTSTDTFRLSEVTILENQFETNFNQGFKVIIPLKTIQELIRQLSLLKEDVETIIYFNPNQVCFEINQTEIISRLIDGEFPEYNKIIPKEFKFEVLVDKNQLINALKLTSVFSNQFNEVKFLINKNSKVLEIFSVSENTGKNNFLLPIKIQSKKDEKLEIAFNWKYFLDGLKNIKNNELLIGFNNSDKPTIIKLPQNSYWFYLLMPIKS